MGSEKPNFLSQPVVKSVFMFRNGDPYYEARRIVINQKRVSNFETLLREVTGGIQAPFGAVRNIYTPREGHKVDCLESLQSGEQYVAAGRERFKKLDYQQIGLRRKRMMQTLPMQSEENDGRHKVLGRLVCTAKPLPPNRIIVSARFLKPLKEPCTIFVVANGDVMNPAVRLLIHQRMLGQFDKILEMITERMGLRCLGGVRSLYTYEGQQVSGGNQLESGQLYVAVGRERFKKLPYSDLLFTKPRGTRKVNGMKAYSLPPIYRFSKQNGNNKSVVRSSDSGDSKASPPSNNGSNKEHLSSIVREISQARLISLRKKRSGQSMTLGVSDNDDPESKADDGNTEDKTPKDQTAEEKPDDTKVAEENGEKVEEKEEAATASNATEEDTSASKEEKEENPETNGEKEGEEVKKEDEQKNDEKQAKAAAESEEKEEVVEEKVKEEVTDESKEEVKGEEQGSSSSKSDKTQDDKEKEDGSHTSSEGEQGKQGKNEEEEEKQDKDSGKGEKSSEEQVNDVDTGEEQKEAENSNDPGKTQSDNEAKESDTDRKSSSNSNQEEDVSQTKEVASKESGEEEKKVNGEVSREDDEVESEAELDLEEKNSASRKDAPENEEKEDGNKEKPDKSRKEKE